MRADHNYQELLLSQIAELEAQIEEDGTATEETLDRYRGRQVWIEHGNGVVTRYCHLNSISAEILILWFCTKRSSSSCRSICLRKSLSSRAMKP